MLFPNLVSLLAGLLTANVQTADDLAMFRGDTNHTGVYAGANPTLSGVVWKAATAGPVVSSPVVAGSSVYVGSSDHSLYALNRADGTVRWKFATQGPVNSSPAVRAGVVYVNSVDGRFYAVDAVTGKQRWNFRTSGERRFTAPGIHGGIPRTEMMADPFDVLLSSPVIAGNAVYFGSGDHNVYALNAETGALLWKFETGNVVHATPAVANGVVFIGSWDRNLYALDAATGKERWHYQTGNDTTTYNQIGIASSAAVVNGIVYFGCRDGHFYAVDASTGQQKWNVDNKMGWVIASPAVSKGVVYFPTSDGKRFKAIDAITGAVKYSIENREISFSSPAIVNNVVYFGSSDGWIHAMDISTGAMKAEFQSDGSKANASKYLDKDGHMIGAALYPDFTLDGIIIGVHRMFELGSFISSPVVAAGVLYVGSTDGGVYALR